MSIGAELRSKRKRKDLTGQKYEFLTILEEVACPDLENKLQRNLVEM